MNSPGDSGLGRSEDGLQARADRVQPEAAPAPYVEEDGLPRELADLRSQLADLGLDW